MTSGTDLRRKPTIFAYFTGVLLAAVTGVACSSSSSAVDQDAGRTSSSSAAPATSVRPIEIGPTGPGLPIEVIRVSDGDSLRATSAEGELEIRLIGINAPERDDCFGDQATTALEALLMDEPVTLHPWPGETDQFGRELGLLTAGETFVNLSLLETGHAVARSQSDHGFEDEFEEAERTAANSGMGLWAANACGEPSEASLVIVHVEDDPPGDDRQNPNGEWVIIENQGDAEVSLDGWVLRDESTRHRYAFPDVMVSAGSTVQVRTGCGEDTRDGAELELFWCDPEPPIWNNGGDTAFLLDPNGSIADNYVTQG